jgi:chorismate lyase/3-hydroxybenzoate synthase
MDAQAFLAATNKNRFLVGLVVFMMIPAYSQEGPFWEIGLGFAGLNFPARYGAKSPCFSRATLKSWKAEDHLYISGTSSIVGHESLHRYDPLGQLQETLRNLDGLIVNANRYRPLGIASTADLSLLKVYIRDALHFEPLRKHLINALGPTADTVFLRGDICRANLQIEIEGAYLGCP